MDLLRGVLFGKAEKKDKCRGTKGKGKKNALYHCKKYGMNCGSFTLCGFTLTEKGQAAGSAAACS